MLSAEQLARATRLHADASAIDPENREHYLEERCNDDSEVAEFVRKLWRSDHLQLSGFLEPIGDTAILAQIHTEAEDPEATITDPEVGKKGGSTGSIPVVERIAHYRLIEELGAGGQGQVFRAEDTKLGRQVALKLLSRNLMLSTNARQRFHREATVTSRLDHPGICTVYEVGHHDGVPFIAMQLVEGTPLNTVISNAVQRHQWHKKVTPLLEATSRATATGTKDPSLLEAFSPVLELFEDLARTVQAAHAAGLVHRDIKPANIMVTPGGRGIVLDFGLARDSDSADATLTQTGDVMGTPNYMSPEQLDGGKRLDARTDVWSLGVTLFEALCLHSPFAAATREELYRRIRTEPMPDPRQFMSGFPSDLRVVLETTMEKAPDKRYQRALDLAEDLRRIREREPILAQKVSSWRRLARWAQRHRVVAAASVITLAALIGGTAVSLKFAFDADRKKVEAETTLAAWTRLADSRRLDDLIREANEDLWPVLPTKLPEFESWLVRAGELLERLPDHRRALDQLRSQALPWDASAQRNDAAADVEAQARLERIGLESVRLEQALKAATADHQLFTDALVKARKSEAAASRINAAEVRVERVEEALESILSIRDAHAVESEELLERTKQRRTWSFNDPDRQFRHTRLSELVSGLEALQQGAGPATVTVAAVERRRDLAVSIQRIDAEAATPWQRAAADVARADSPYSGLKLSPISGLVPLGIDKDSKNWEFWHVASGVRPHWNGEPLGEGKVELGKVGKPGDEGLVLVLLPGGPFTMGSHMPSPEHTPGEPHVDPGARPFESPPHEVVLAPYLISKFEMTQGQWVRLWQKNPSRFRPENEGEISGVISHLGYPMSNTSWDECAETCRRLDLAIPTEAQWESAARAGTSTVFFTGDDPLSLQAYANIADSTFKESIVTTATFEEGFRDGFVMLAPAGAMKPNPNGLHNTAGNVFEWCADGRNGYEEYPAQGPDGFRGPMLGAELRIIRGGAFSFAARNSRSAYRYWVAPNDRSDTSGFRPSRLIHPEE